MNTNKALEKAILLGDLQSVKLLLKGKDPDCVTDTYGRTVLYDAVVKGYIDIVSELCLAKANVNHQYKVGKAPLHFAAIHNQLDIAKVLIQSGADLNLRDNNGNNPIFDAIFHSKGDPDIIILLKENEADYVTPNKHGISPKELANTIASFVVSYIFS